MNTNSNLTRVAIARMEDPLARLAELASQVRRETDAVQNTDDGFVTSRYTGRDPKRLAAQAGRRKVASGARVRGGSKNKRRGLVVHVARKGEVRMKEFVGGEAARCGVTKCVIYRRLIDGKYPEVDIRRVNQRVAFVLVRSLELLADTDKRPGEIPLKEFVSNEAVRLGMKYHAVYARLNRGKYPGMTVRRAGHYAAFVAPAAPDNGGNRRRQNIE